MQLQFDPRNISGCALWLDATDSSSMTLNSTTVSQWRDKSGKGNNAIQATTIRQPLLVASGINGMPALEGRHDGVNASQLSIAHNATLNFSSGITGFAVGYKTVMATSGDLVAKYVTSTPDRSFLITTNASNQVQGVISTDGTAGASANINTGGFLITSGVGYIASLWDNGTIGVATGNDRGEAQATIGYPFLASGAPLNIFSRDAAFVNPYIGRIGEVILFTRTLTRSEIDIIRRYLALKWRIAI